MLAELIAAARDVGRMLLEIRDRGGREGKWEADHQFKALADAKAHQRYLALLGRIDPSLPVVSEEGHPASDLSRPRRYFLIDPLDGTASYAGGFDGFVTQAALMEEGQPTLAVVHAPVFDETFSAHRGGGAWKNGMPMHTAPAAGNPSFIDNTPAPDPGLARLMARLGVTGYRESGSIGLKICRVAEGSAQFFVKDVTVRDWDLAAPHLILSEAGGQLVDRAGHPILYSQGYEKNGLIAAASGELCNHVLAQS